MKAKYKQEKERELLTSERGSVGNIGYFDYAQHLFPMNPLFSISCFIKM
ncbi:hypothetical protein SAMN05444285_11622 [Draconibacterium orientale]|uniref:Uncharacterized protein n=1 Tax=Draconibacterium orientale TaxID=1168034 RepID=A0A1I0FBH8_9BACT|nr:hypothetical protein SAMN05444285_11622 [Draconibacterium orientale]